MTDPSEKPAAGFKAEVAPDRRIEGLAKLLGSLSINYESLAKSAAENTAAIVSFKDQIVADQDKTRRNLLLEQSKLRDILLVEQNKLRSVLLAKIDGLQGTVDLVRQDIRNSWNTADFAIINSRQTREEAEKTSRQTREETDKILSIISTMQKQQQLSTSQVEELRRRAAEKDHGF